MAEKQILSFDNHYSRQLKPIRRYMDAGTREKKDYMPVYDKAGVWHLEEKKGHKIQTYLEIQSYADECDINVIMARYRNGETDVLSQIQGVYGDFSNVPTNYAEILNDTIKMEQIFMSLAPEVRERFNNSVEQFGASLGTKEWQDVMFPPKSEQATAPVAAVKEGDAE